MTARSKRRQSVIVALGATAIVAAIGTIFTDLGPWYQSLREPGWRPADENFGLIWSFIFATAALSAIFAWEDTREERLRWITVGLFAANGAFNNIWSLLFFTVRRPDIALAEVGLLWLSIVLIMMTTARSSWRASLLLLPYLVWVTLAGVLNYDVVRLNGPFG